MLIAVPNLAIGNFASVLRMLQKVGGEAKLVTDPAALRTADKVIVAGVGAFDLGMASITEGGWLDALNEAALHRKVPVLGICLGMQLMCSGSEEGTRPGLGWIDAQVQRIGVPPGTDLKVPHMGWNSVAVRRPNPLIPAEEPSRFYFVHSYHAVCADPSDVIATVHHGADLTAAVARGNILGVQFHPEKSHRFGMALMRAFVAHEC